MKNKNQVFMFSGLLVLVIVVTAALTYYITNSQKQSTPAQAKEQPITTNKKPPTPIPPTAFTIPACTKVQETQCKNGDACVVYNADDKVKLASFTRETGSSTQKKQAYDSKRGARIGLNYTGGANPTDPSTISDANMKFLGREVKIMSCDTQFDIAGVEKKLTNGSWVSTGFSGPYKGCIPGAPVPTTLQVPGHLQAVDYLMQEAKYITDDKKVLFTIGTQNSGATYSSPTSSTLLQYFKPISRLLISAASTGVILTDGTLGDANLNNPAFYARLVFNDAQQGGVMANFAKNERSASNSTNVVTIDDNVFSYGRGLTAEFRKVYSPSAYMDNGTALDGTATDLEYNGSTYTGVSQYHLSGTNTATDIANKIALLDPTPKFIFFAGNTNSETTGKAVVDALQIALSGKTFDVAFGDTQNTNTFAASVAGVNGGAIYASGPSAAKAAQDNPIKYGNIMQGYANLSVTDTAEYANTDGSATSSYHIYGFDIPAVMEKAAFATACQSGSDLLIHRGTLYKNLLKTKDFQGLAATYTCDTKGACNPHPTVGINKDGGNTMVFENAVTL